MPFYVLVMSISFRNLCMKLTYVSRHQTLDSVNFSNGIDRDDIARLKHVYCTDMIRVFISA